ncbi:type II toxin-antitoxin system Phd/YefM family antitoxin [Dyadobacter aurulentus]|uniref:type II toxin-antitoxin system Phd/YefM family antitoxin n=1 Tax=Dyadobacter sp. UC 10 TaxID=2605428 RepID=UPI0011F39538|nr:prevent-host-death protein [Dyadobacter sp. UC 10]KAA0992510.1 prevent-host-death protein [Dyadobacter sp. UC 10]
MKTMSVGEFKAQFSKVLKEVEQGEKIGITFGKKKEVKAMLVPKDKPAQPRKLGILKEQVKVEFKGDFKMTEEEFLGL